MYRLLALVLALTVAAPAQRAQPTSDLSAELQAFVDSGRARAIAALVGQGGKILHESYHGQREDGKPVGRGTLFCLGSCSKPLVSALALRLVADGKLVLDAPVSLPGCDGLRLADGTRTRMPTLRELLQHTAGIYSQRNALSESQRRWIRDFSLTLAQAVRGILAEPLLAAPGSRFAYSGAGYCVAGRVLEVAGGSDLETLARKRLFGPLGMTRTTWFPSAAETDIANAQAPALASRAPHRLGQRLALPLVGGSVYSTARDAARFLHAIADPNAAVLPARVRSELDRKLAGGGYGLGWRVIERAGAPAELTHNGALYGYRAIFDVDRSTGRYFVVLATLGGRATRRTPVRIFQTVRSASVASLAPRKPASDEELGERIQSLCRPLIDRKISVGLIVGVLRGGKTLFRGFGATEKGGHRVPDPDTVWEIGSITKVFTGVLLAHAVQQGVVRLDDPVAKHLPEGTKVPSYENVQIRLVDLATHGSGLPRMPVNFRPKDRRNPYADYGVLDLYAGLARTRLRQKPGTGYAYSNLAQGLLGHVLTRVLGNSYAALVRDVITKPLGMNDTAVHLTPSMRERLAKPYAINGVERWNWDFDCLAGCGALRSTARDLLKFARANLSPGDSELGKALRATQVVHSPKWRGPSVGLGWHINGGRLFHNGGTGGYASCLLIDRAHESAVVVIGNTVSREVDTVGRRVMSFLTATEPAGK